MAGHVHRHLPDAKTKTDLRRGQFTPGNPAAKKSPAPPRRDTATTNAEQALLFDESSDRAK